MAEADERRHRDMLRVRDHIDRSYAEPLDVAGLAALVHVSPDHLVRTFRRVFGETPHRYLQRRRLERAMLLLATTDRPVTDVCLAVGYESLGAFSELFSSVVGCSPSVYRERTVLPDGVPGPFVMAWTRPSTHTHTSVSRKRPEAPDA